MKEIIDIIDDLPTHTTKQYPERNLADITHIDVHHSASHSSNYKGIPTIKSYANYHIDHHDWPGIGYDYVVAPDAQIYKTGYDGRLGWSVGSNNSYTISTMVIGDYTQESLDDDVLESLLFMLNRKHKAYSVPISKIKGHTEYPGHASNQCPGFNMDKIRGLLKEKY